MAWRDRQQSDHGIKCSGERNITLPTYKSTGVLPHNRGVLYCISPSVYLIQVFEIRRRPKRNPHTFAPWIVPLNVPPSKNDPEEFGTQTLTVARNGFPTHVLRSDTHWQAQRGTSTPRQGACPRIRATSWQCDTTHFGLLPRTRRFACAVYHDHAHAYTSDIYDW